MLSVKMIFPGNDCDYFIQNNELADLTEFQRLFHQHRLQLAIDSKWPSFRHQITWILNVTSIKLHQDCRHYSSHSYSNKFDLQSRRRQVALITSQLLIGIKQVNKLAPGYLNWR